MYQQKDTSLLEDRLYVNFAVPLIMKISQDKISDNYLVRILVLFCLTGIITLFNAAGN